MRVFPDASKRRATVRTGKCARKWIEDGSGHLRHKPLARGLPPPEPQHERHGSAPVSVGQACDAVSGDRRRGRRI